MRKSKDRPSVSSSIGLVPPVNKQARTSLIVSLMFIFGSCLAAVLLWMSLDDSVSTVVAASDIDRGQVITPDDLKVVKTSGGFDKVTSIDSLVNKVAANSLAAGDPVSMSDVAGDVSVSSGDSVVGVLLKPGAYPTSNISPGSRVDVIGSLTASEEARLLASNIEVFDVSVSDSGSGDEVLFALVLSTDEAVDVANAVKHSGGVRISLRGSS